MTMALDQEVDLSPDAPLVENEKGGVQSRLEYSFNLLDPKAMFAIAKVMYQGEQKYKDRDNWKRINSEDHINHALVHIYAHLAGDAQDDHLEHAFCRLMMAVATKEVTKE